MAWIKFRGVSSDELGLQVERMPGNARAKRRVKQQPVAGRAPLHQDENAHESVILKALINIMNRGDVDRINDWLSGYGDLILSDDPTRRWKALAIEEVPHARYRPYGRNYDTVSVMWECDPYRYEANPEVRTITSGQILTNMGTVIAAPLIEVRGSGDVSIQVGGVGVTLEGMSGTVTIDSDAMIAYKGAEDNYVEITLDDGDWPMLGLGGTPIVYTGSVTELKITPNWRWL